MDIFSSRTMHRSWAALLAAILAGGALSAQGLVGHPSSIRSWGKYVSDTEAREGRFVRVSAGHNATAVLRSDGRLFIQGDNYWGNCDVPPSPPGLHYVDVAIDITAVGLLSDGSIQVWGWDDSAGSMASVPALPAGHSYERIAAGSGHALALRSDGACIAWGRNLEGQCNVPALPQGRVWRDISAGPHFSLGLLDDGAVLAWGADTHGQMSIPMLPPGVQYTSVNAGRHHAVAVRSDGQVVAWGNNQQGQCNVPPLPVGTTYVLAAAGESHSHAVRSDGVIVTWGATGLGLGDPPALPPSGKVVQLDCGINHSVALLATGEVLAWGSNRWLQAYLPSLPKQPEPLRFTGLSVGYQHVLGRTSDASMVGWGVDFASIAEIPSHLQRNRWRRSESTYAHNLALDERGRLYAWGHNFYGQLNVPVLPAGVTYTEVFSAAPTHSVAIRSDGVAVAFGTTYMDEGVIPPLPAGLSYTDVDTEHLRTVLLRSDGEVLCLGDAASGQAQVAPLPVGVQYVDIAASRFCTAGLRSDGLVEIWGSVQPPAFEPLPALPFGVSYVQAEGAYAFLAMRRSDGEVVTCGYMPNHQDVVTPLLPGTSYVEMSAGGEIVAARVGPTCTYVSFAPGCAGSRPVARLIPRDTPHLGKTLEVTLFDLPLDIAFLVFGWQQLPSPVDLGFLGMPGCDLSVSLDAIVPLVGQNQQAKWFLPIPNDPIWVGTRFYNQALVPDPAAGNSFGAVVSDAAEAVIGHW